MDMNGLKLTDFGNHEEALELADTIIAQSVQEHGHQYAMISFGNPLTDKYFYIESKGRTKTWTQSYTKQIARSSNPKSLKAIQGSGVAEGLLDGSDVPGLAIEDDAGEVPKVFEKLKTVADVGRSHRCHGLPCDPISGFNGAHMVHASQTSAPHTHGISPTQQRLIILRRIETKKDRDR